MSTATPEAELVVDRELLARVVARSLDRDQVELTDWTVRPVHGGIGETLGVFRLAGELADGTTWSVILKAIGRPPFGGGPGDWNDWRREAHLYQSDAADDLPDGLVRARSFDVTENGDDQLWIWLEDVPDPHTPWTLDEFARLAELVGRFDAQYLNGRPLPEGAWLSRGWLRKRLDAVAPVMTGFSDLAAGNPWLSRLFTPELLEQILPAWDDRDRLLTLLDDLPRTFGHRDLFPRNALRRPDRDEVVLVDWAFTGDAAIGEALSILVAASLSFFEAQGEVAAGLEATVLDAYTAGLRAGGWDGDPRLAELGYRVGSMLWLPWANIDSIAGGWGDERMHPILEAVFGAPIELQLAAFAQLCDEYVVPNAAAARALAAALER